MSAMGRYPTVTIIPRLSAFGGTSDTRMTNPSVGHRPEVPVRLFRYYSRFPVREELRGSIVEAPIVLLAKLRLPAPHVPPKALV